MNRAELIDHEASRWLASRDVGTRSPEEISAFQQWLDADIRHRVAYLRMEAAWQRSDRLRDLRPLDRGVDADLLAPPRRTWSLALAASMLIALFIAGGWFAHTQLGWQHYETRIGSLSRIVLEDGSVVDLNTNSDIRVRIGTQRREIRLLRGEGRFQVAHDKSRPFVVSAAKAAVRAVGTEFSVRLHSSAQVDVLVSEGVVAIESGRVAHSPPVHAGESAIVFPDRVSVSRVDPQLLQRRYAWTTGQLQFRGETLAEAVSEFNRYNRRQLRLADPSLAQLRVGGNFNATDPESFAAALGSAFSLRVASADPDAIVLRPP
jgi:transmembrane sensor